jgi:hypothetical protein
MLVPLYGFLQGDTLGLIVLVQDSDRVRDIAACLEQAASVRVAPKREPRVYFKGQPLDLERTVAEVGLTALDRVDVVEETS